MNNTEMWGGLSQWGQAQHSKWKETRLWHYVCSCHINIWQELRLALAVVGSPDVIVKMARDWRSVHPASKVSYRSHNTWIFTVTLRLAVLEATKFLH
jgi:hypothetical protein